MCSLYRVNARRDGNEAAIVETLTKRGYTVDRISAPGVPDLLISKGGNAMWLAEVKRAGGTLTPAQVKWRARWQGPPPHLLVTVEDALAFPGVVATRSAA